MPAGVRRREHEVGVGEGAELRYVETLDLDVRRDEELDESLRDREDDPGQAPRPEEPDENVEDLRGELAAVAVEESLHAVVRGCTDAVPTLAVGPVGEQADREHAPGAGHPVHRDRPARIVDVPAVEELD